MIQQEKPSRGTTRIQIAKPDIISLFENSPQKIFAIADLAKILDTNRSFWRLAQSTNVRRFVEFLVEKTQLQRVDLRSGRGRDIIRYSWGKRSPYELALSIGPNSYLCHATALFLHQLTDQIPKVIYVNQEQSPKPEPGFPLTQEGINRAFSHPQRTSNYVFSMDDATRIVVVSGKNTGRLEVGSVNGPDGEHLDCTKIERTLIDVTVRPAYAGGIFQVLEAYRAARPRVSTNVLIATLKKLAYVYPYHQAIGLLMEKAGYDQAALSRLKALGLAYDFFLAHGAEKTQYDSGWRIYYPEGL